MKIPPDFSKKLRINQKAKAAWQSLTPISRRDFVSWIMSAKQAGTRVRRIDKACDMLVSGKRRPCCYAIVPMGLYKALDAHLKAKENWKKLTPDERRDFARWVDEAPGSQEREMRVSRACARLASGKRKP